MDKSCSLTKICHFLPLLLTLLISFSSTQPTSAASRVSPSYVNFVKTKCNAATYPQLCIKTLSPYASYVQTNPLRLCNVALTVAIQGAYNASKTVSKLAAQKGLSRVDAAALKDCIYQTKDAISELKQALVALGHLRGADREFEWSNAKTWASAAITDAETCRDNFTGKRVNPVLKQKIRSLLLTVEKIVSNALFLINHLY